MPDPSTWPPGLVLAVAALAVHRITRLVTDDEIAAPVRRRIATYSPGPGQLRLPRTRGVGRWFGYLVTCPWCVSVYVGAVLAGILAAGGWPIVAWPAVAAATSSVAGLLPGAKT